MCRLPQEIRLFTHDHKRSDGVIFQHWQFAPEVLCGHLELQIEVQPDRQVIGILYFIRSALGVQQRLVANRGEQV